VQSGTADCGAGGHGRAAVVIGEELLTLGVLVLQTERTDSRGYVTLYQYGAGNEPKPEALKRAL